ncbi:MAG: hypothetical protein JSR76_07980 [Verrucomicrobia bacterium]|nr:hypothetical protein [Verrucomicrobiota bacterium]
MTAVGGYSPTRFDGELNTVQCDRATPIRDWIDSILPRDDSDVVAPEVHWDRPTEGAAADHETTRGELNREEHELANAAIEILRHKIEYIKTSRDIEGRIFTPEQLTLFKRVSGIFKGSIEKVRRGHPWLDVTIQFDALLSAIQFELSEVQFERWIDSVVLPRDDSDVVAPEVHWDRPGEGAAADYEEIPRILQE